MSYAVMVSNSTVWPLGWVHTALNGITRYLVRDCHLSGTQNAFKLDYVCPWCTKNYKKNNKKNSLTMSRVPHMATPKTIRFWEVERKRNSTTISFNAAALSVYSCFRDNTGMQCSSSSDNTVCVCRQCQVEETGKEGEMDFSANKSAHTDGQVLIFSSVTSRKWWHSFWAVADTCYRVTDGRSLGKHFFER